MSGETFFLEYTFVKIQYLLIIFVKLMEREGQWVNLGRLSIDYIKFG